MIKKELSHLNEKGEAQMVDVSEKTISKRQAIARAHVFFPAAAFALLKEDNFTNKKGAVITTAVIAGIQAAKRTSDLIPLCHPLQLSKVAIDITPGENVFEVVCTVRCEGKTGVEMEALTGVMGAALTIYDMCKALTHEMEISEVKLIQKSGGKNDFSN